MRPSSLRTNSESGSGGGRTTLTTNKPPIPPKPLISSRLRPLADPRQELVSISGDGLITSGYYPVPRYSTYPTAVLINDENIPYVNDHPLYYNNSLETITPLLPVTYSDDKYNGTIYRSHLSLNHVLPPLTKAEITPSYVLSQGSPQALELRNTTRTSNRILSASAKNALLKEKIGGTFPDSSKEILPRANSNPETSSNGVTVNRSCIISVNNFNDSLSNNNINNNNNNDIRHTRNRQKKLSTYDNTKPVTYNETANYALPVVSTSNLTKTDYIQNGVDIVHNEICPNCKNYQINCQCERRVMRELFPVYIVTENTNASYDSEKYINGKVQDNLPNTKSLNAKNITNEDETDCAAPVERFKIIIHNGPSTYSSSQSAPCSPATKPLLRKSEAVDVEDYDYYKKLSRGISRATDNVNIVSKARSEIAQGIWEALESGNSIKNSPFFIETPVFTFTLPDLTIYSDEFRQFLEKDLIEMSTLISLEAAGRLNWWAIIGASQRLWPLATTGDGNCLLHAASLGMWGFHDRLLTLRKALHEFLTRSQYSRPLWRRWRWQLALQNRETGLVFSQDEWEEEWASVLRLASSAPRGGSQPPDAITGSAPNLSNTSNSLSQGKLDSEISGPVYESLEEIHVLALAHVLRRPIIVVADTTLKDMNGDPLAPIPFGGIYLPLECPPNECQRSPLLLTYDAAHFSALVIMESNEKTDPYKVPLPAVIPVTDCAHDLLPIQFLVDPGEDFVWSLDELDDTASQKYIITNQDQKGLLSDYLDLGQIPIPSTYLEASSATLGQDDLSPHDMTDPLLDIDKKSSESSFDSDEGPPFADGGSSSKGKGPKQLTTVVRSFGSIGRSMSKRIKKNLSKLGRTGSLRRKAPHLSKGDYSSKSNKAVKVGTHQNYILAATIHTEKRQAYQQEMIENYLANARERFLRDSPSQRGTKLGDITNVTSVATSTTTSDIVSNASTDRGLVQCINSGCNFYGSAKTSYMCASCFEKQKEQEEKEYQRQSTTETKIDRYGSGVIAGDTDQVDATLHSPTSQFVRGEGMQYGAGKSKFYAQLDEASIKNATLIPVTQTKTGARDKTIFLSNSTFYNDTAITASIPSYNLNRDLRRESKKSRNGTKFSDISVSSRSSSSLSDPVSMVHVSPSGKDSLAPISIDDVRINIKKPDPGIPQKVNLPPSAPTTVADINAYNYMNQSKPCLTKGCEFYGNIATEYLCSKCHSNKKKETSKTS